MVFELQYTELVLWWIITFNLLLPMAPRSFRRNLNSLFSCPAQIVMVLVHSHWFHSVVLACSNERNDLKTQFTLPAQHHTAHTQLLFSFFLRSWWRGKREWIFYSYLFGGQKQDTNTSYITLEGVNNQLFANTFSICVFFFKNVNVSPDINPEIKKLLFHLTCDQTHTHKKSSCILPKLSIFY